MGGRSTIKELLKIDPDVRAVVSSGYSNDSVMANFPEHGFCDAVLKPYKTKDLGKALRRAIDHSAVKTH